MRRLIGPFEKDRLDLSAEPLPDTRLWPGERRRFTYLMAIDPTRMKTPFRARAEVWYHVLDESETHQFGFSREQVEWIVRSEEVLISER